MKQQTEQRKEAINAQNLEKIKESHIEEEYQEQQKPLEPKEAIGNSYMQRFKSDLSMSQFGKTQMVDSMNSSMVKEDNTGMNRSLSSLKKQGTGEAGVPPAQTVSFNFTDMMKNIKEINKQNSIFMGNEDDENENNCENEDDDDDSLEESHSFSLENSDQ